MLSYELAKQLKESGFPQKIEDGDKYYLGYQTQPPRKSMEKDWQWKWEIEGLYAWGEPEESDKDDIKIPNLSELIEAVLKGNIPKCYKVFKYDGTRFSIQRESKKEGQWYAGFMEYDNYESKSSDGGSPEESVAKLWLKLNKHKL